MNRVRACPVCQAERAAPRFERDGFALVQCAGCGLLFVADDPVQINFQELYGQAYYTGGHASVFADYTGQAAARRASARRRLAWLRHVPPRIARRGRLLDVGCAAGFFLAEAQAHYEVQGVELSEWSVRYAQQQLRLPVFCGTLQQAALPARHFDVVTLWDVIEHVPDPVPLLQEAARVLAPGGRLVLTTGDWGSAYAQAQGSRWHLLTPPWHLSFFSRATLAHAAQRAGLRVRAWRSEGVGGDGRLWRHPLALALTRLFDRGDIVRATLEHAPA